MIVPIMASRFVGRRNLFRRAGVVPCLGSNLTFLLIGTVLLVGALNFLPALTWDPCWNTSSCVRNCSKRLTFKNKSP